MGDLLDRREVGLAVRLGGRPDRDEDDVRAAHGIGQLGRELEPAVGDVAGDELLEAGLVDRHPPGAEPLDLGAVLVDADDVVPQVGEDRARHEPHVSGPHHRDVHPDRLMPGVAPEIRAALLCYRTAPGAASNRARVSEVVSLIRTRWLGSGPPVSRLDHGDRAPPRRPCDSNQLAKLIVDKATRGGPT